MVAYSFQKQFVAPILAGAKCQTIRADRRRHARIGESLQLYTGMRTKQCRLIGLAKCHGVSPITINMETNSVLTTEGELHGWGKLDEFAEKDGFDSWLMMRAFWRDHHPSIVIFSGVLIQWSQFRKEPPPDGARGSE